MQTILNKNPNVFFELKLSKVVLFITNFRPDYFTGF